MIDIHSHILPYVDDGSNDSEESISLLENMVSQGVDKIICTPHYKRGIYDLSASQIRLKFNEFNNLVIERNIPVKLYLGSEILCDDRVYDVIKNGNALTINDKKFVLIEFNYFYPDDVIDYAYNVKTMGYTPIIAHVERYNYLTIEDIFELKNLGALIQINTSSIVGENGKEFRKKAFNAIKRGLVDFISTDAHVNRKVEIEKCYKIIKRKFNKEVADNLFENNAKILL
ncbi:MAG: hypothetical protein E7358_00715 [Clostridiales bacterium]|nr:hypothetical protein [Clostridiales bacterium]